MSFGQSLSGFPVVAGVCFTCVSPYLGWLSGDSELLLLSFRLVLGGDTFVLADSSTFFSGSFSLTITTDKANKVYAETAEKQFTTP